MRFVAGPVSGPRAFGDRALKVVVLRDPKESIRKCSLTPLRRRNDFTFLEWRGGLSLFDASGMTLLAVDAPSLSRVDSGRPVLVLDCSWKKVERMTRCLRGEPPRRSIPEGLVTAYPRKSKTFPDPEAGLASVEALFVASLVLGEEDRSLLEGYPFVLDFLERNRGALERARSEKAAPGISASASAGEG